MTTATLTQSNVKRAKSIMKTGLIAAGLAATMTITAVAPLAAKGREFLGGYRDWDAFLETRAKGEKSCYIISVPKETQPKNVKRGEIYVIVTHWPQAKIKSQTNVVLGYPLKKDSEVTVTIDKQSFRLFVEGDRAWAYDDKQDAAMSTAMRKGTTMTVKGVSQRGTETTDRYSLAGISAAYNAITQACY